jgi:hypothetical protein
MGIRLSRRVEFLNFGAQFPFMSADHLWLKVPRLKSFGKKAAPVAGAVSH